MRVIESPVYHAKYHISERVAVPMHDVQQTNGKSRDGEFQNDEHGIHNMNVDLYDTQGFPMKPGKHAGEENYRDNDCSWGGNTKQKPT